MRPLFIICSIAATWLTLALAAMIPGSIATAAVPSGTPIPDDIAIVGTAPGLILVRSDDPDYVRKLYRAGATFVLPARQKTCLALQG